MTIQSNQQKQKYSDVSNNYREKIKNKIIELSKARKFKRACLYANHLDFINNA